MDNPCAEYTCIEFKTNTRPVCLRIQVARSAAEIDQWLERNPTNVMGLDIEWKPTFKQKQRPNRASLLQLSSGDEAILIQIFKIGTTPRLLEILAEVNIAKIGVGIQGDVDKLQADWGIAVNGAVDIGGGRSLKNVVLQATGVRLKKLKSVSMSNWEQDALSNEQIIYAGLDAWSAAEAFVARSAVQKGICT